MKVFNLNIGWYENKSDNSPIKHTRKSPNLSNTQMSHGVTNPFIGVFHYGGMLKKQVLNPQKGVSGHHSYKLPLAIWISPVVTSWRSESSNRSLVVLDKLIFAISKHLFRELEKHDRRTDRTAELSLLAIKQKKSHTFLIYNLPLCLLMF